MIRWDAMPGSSRRSETFVYDSVDRLVQSQVTNRVGLLVRDSVYTLDGAGNRLNVSSDPAPGNYTLDPTLPEPADAQLNQYTATPFDGGRQYDANGNLVAITNGPPEGTFHYDYANRLVQLTPANGSPVVYGYDALGRRIQKNDGGQTTRYLYDGKRVIEEQDGQRNTLATYIRSSDGALLSMRRGASDFFYHLDDQGSVVALSDAAGGLVERYTYEDFGQPIIASHVQWPDGLSAYVSDVDTNQFVADDFAFDQPTRIYGMRWWGAYAFGSPPPSDDFTIRIHADNLGEPGTVLLTEAVGNNVTRTATGRNLMVGPAEFVYEALLTTPFEVQTGTMYWLEIVNDTTGNAASWGFSTARRGNGSMAGSEDGGTTWDTVNDDAAFELLASDSGVSNPYLFAGQRYDRATGWFQHGSRFLDPLAGRYIHRNPRGSWAALDGLGNGFSFAQNNPWRLPLLPADQEAIAPRNVISPGCGAWFTLDHCDPLSVFRNRTFPCRCKTCGLGCPAKACAH